MFGKFISKLNQRYLILMFWGTGILVAIAAGVLYWQRDVWQESAFVFCLFLLFFLILTWGTLVAISRHIYWRDGFIDGIKDGYHKGRADGLNGGLKKARQPDERT